MRVKSAGLLVGCLAAETQGELSVEGGGILCEKSWWGTESQDDYIHDRGV